MHCSKLSSMLKYSFLRRLPINYEKNGFGCITLTVNIQGWQADVLPIFLHLTTFNYLFTNYFITVVINLIYYIYSLHVDNIELSKDGFVLITRKVSLKARMIYFFF